MFSYVALYRGKSLRGAELVAVSANAELVCHVTRTLLKRKSDAADDDPAVNALEAGRRRALRILAKEAAGGGEVADATNRTR